ncbi:hypothetical protein NPX13_g101 [Xylaria arbuscula]|uniref:Uncharacterized protein n=1 Tax=Xylaria arbuscula TaxID=114810 RepID=A0A9W8NNF9_9PEZI|nr:hypothetical protein NPX13_g101 [Xylaria arbuscula]
MNQDDGGAGRGGAGRGRGRGRPGKPVSGPSRPRKHDRGYYQARGLRAEKTKYVAPSTTRQTRLSTGALEPQEYRFDPMAPEPKPSRNAYSSENDEQVPLSQYIEERGIQPDLEEPIDDVDEGRQEPSSRQPVSFQARDEDDSDLGLFEYLAGREVRGKSREIPETPRKRRLASRSPSRRPVKRRQATVFDLDYHNISDESEESSDPSPKQDREEDAYKDHNKESYEPRTLNPDEEFRAKLRDLEEAMSMLTLHDRREIPRRRSRGLFDNIHPGFRDREMASMRYTVSRGGRVVIRKHLRDAIRCCHSCA